MRVQLAASQQSSARSAARSSYWRGLSLAFRYLKAPLSALSNRVSPRAEWPGHNDTWATLAEFGQWLPGHVRWKADPLNGVIDRFPDRATIAAQFRDKGVFEEDCDGLAFFAAQNVPQFVENPAHVFIVTMILDPYTFPKKPLLYAAHVICVFEHESAWRVISNDTLYPQHFESFAAAVQTNPYCADHPVLWVEVRSNDLRRLASGSDLAQVEDRVRAKTPR